MSIVSDVSPHEVPSPLRNSIQNHFSSLNSSLSYSEGEEGGESQSSRPRPKGSGNKNKTKNRVEGRVGRSEVSFALTQRPGWVEPHQTRGMVNAGVARSRRDTRERAESGQRSDPADSGQEQRRRQSRQPATPRVIDIEVSSAPRTERRKSHPVPRDRSRDSVDEQTHAACRTDRTESRVVPRDSLQPPDDRYNRSRGQDQLKQKKQAEEHEQRSARASRQSMSKQNDQTGEREQRFAHTPRQNKSVEPRMMSRDSSVSGDDCYDSYPNQQASRNGGQAREREREYTRAPRPARETESRVGTRDPFTSRGGRYHDDYERDQKNKSPRVEDRVRKSTRNSRSVKSNEQSEVQEHRYARTSRRAGETESRVVSRDSSGPRDDRRYGYHEHKNKKDQPKGRERVSAHSSRERGAEREREYAHASHPTREWESPRKRRDSPEPTRGRRHGDDPFDSRDEWEPEKKGKIKKNIATGATLVKRMTVMIMMIVRTISPTYHTVQHGSMASLLVGRRKEITGGLITLRRRALSHR